MCYVWYVQTGMTALMWGAAYGNTECVQLLLSAGADINIQNKVRNILLSLRRCTYLYVRIL